MTSRVRYACIGLLAALPLVGCGEKEEGPEIQDTVPVTGILRYKGKPVRNASVTFHAIDGKVSATGTTDGAGVFILTTYEPEDGAPPGKYKVTVSASGVEEVEPGVLAPEPAGGFKSPVPDKYEDPETTDVLVEVKEEGKNEITITLK